jgi:hypothetical protein
VGAKSPALADERNVVLVGHRRGGRRNSASLPVIKRTSATVMPPTPSGFQLALVSNIGAKPLTAADRQRIAEYLYGEREWTMQRIAQALRYHKDRFQQTWEFRSH